MKDVAVCVHTQIHECTSVQLRPMGFTASVPPSPFDPRPRDPNPAVWEAAAQALTSVLDLIGTREHEHRRKWYAQRPHLQPFSPSSCDSRGDPSRPFSHTFRSVPWLPSGHHPPRKPPKGDNVGNPSTPFPSPPPPLGPLVPRPSSRRRCGGWRPGARTMGSTPPCSP